MFCRVAVDMVYVEKYVDNMLKIAPKLILYVTEITLNKLH
jgi:hypothetical protein